MMQWTDKCAYFNTCFEDSKIPYLKIHFCLLKDATWASYIILPIFLIFYFYLLAQVADRFFIPILGEIATRLNMPSSVAAVTLLAFGNGAPDIFSTYAAVQSGHYQQAFGQVVGASSFISLAIIGIISSAGLLSSVTVYRRPFMKDVGSLCVGLCVVFFVVYDYKIEVWESWFWLSFYGIFVSMTVGARLVFQNYKKKHQEASLKKVRDKLMQLGMKLQVDHPIFELDLEGLGLFNEVHDEADDAKVRKKFKFINKVVGMIERHDFNSLSEVMDDPTDEEFKREALKKLLDQMDVHFLTHVGFWITGKTHHPDHDTHVVVTDNTLGVILDDGEESSQDGKPKGEGLEPIVDIGQVSIQNQDKDPVLLGDDEEEEQVNFVEQFKEIMEFGKINKVFFFLKLPLFMLEHVSIYWAEEGKYFRPFLVAQPLCCLPIAFYFLDLYSANVSFRDSSLGPLIFWVLPIGLALSVAVYCTTDNKTPPPYEPMFLFIGLIMSMLWINTGADELVNCLGVFGDILGVPRAILGLTVLAWGNSVGDLVSNFLIAKKGFPQMVTSAVYTSPVTHVLLGLGISFTVKTTKSGPITLEVRGAKADLTDSLYLNFLFLLGGLLFSLIAVPVSGFRFTRPIGIVLGLLYVGALVIILLDVTKVIFANVDFWSL
uniref:Sodium/calcium exchanger membrane region domain-containing protein n=1 Tax=Arcella intermedia TaxID=1963864 RepID=A0A6B2KZB2_9EUKA